MSGTDRGPGASLARLARAPVELTTATAEFAAVSVRQLSATLPVLGECARALPRLAAALERLDGVGDTLDRLAGAVDHLERLGELAARAMTLADDDAFRAELDRALDAVQRIADATSALDTLPGRVDQLDASIGTVGGKLAAVEPDVRELADMIVALDQSIRVLATAVAPLQGTSERIGRLVDRLPELRRRRDEPIRPTTDER